MASSALAALAALSACGGASSSAPSGDGGSGDSGESRDSGADAGGDAEAGCDTCGSASGFVVTKLYLGDTDWNGAPGGTAWKQFGEDVDGKTSDRTSTDVCTLAAGASPSVKVDGDHGIDNSFGANVLPIFLATFGTGASQQLNVQLAAGKANPLLGVDGLGAADDYASLPSRYYAGDDLKKIPSFDGTDVWPVLFESVDGADVRAPKLAFPGASMAARLFTTGARPATAGLVLPLLSIPVKRARFTMTVSSDGKSATRGVLSGVIPTEDFITAFRAIAGTISTSLCTGSAFDAIAQQIRQASDILSDGTNDAAKACDAISIGVGFEAKATKIGAVSPAKQPLPNPCP